MVNLPIKLDVSTLSRYRYGDMKNVKNAQNGVLWGGYGHPRSSAVSPFDRAHTISYSSFIETMRLSCTVFEILRVFRRNSPTSTYHTCIRQPFGHDLVRISKIFLASETSSPWAIVLRCLHHPIFSSFSRTSTCVATSHFRPEVEICSAS